MDGTMHSKLILSISTSTLTNSTVPVGQVVSVFCNKSNLTPSRTCDAIPVLPLWMIVM